MRIKRLDITGFKSFMDRTVFTFGDGITAVVGPNGCGKSNVVDAIRWVMGEQSAKNLRGRGMEDVIFAGSESHAPLSMAEVSLTFTVEEGDQLPTPWAGFPEVTVTRRLFRSGESEYLINKQTCRLLDVTELFLGTGVGTRAYSIIEQGRVGLIVSSKPEDRRQLIEEAAGITRYKARRRSAERKMESTRANLLRVNDVVGELDKRMDAVQRQAKRAEKARRLRGQMREIELHAASHRFLELLAERQQLEARLSGMGEAEQAALASVKAMEEDIEARRAAHDAETEALRVLQEEVHALERQASLDAQSLSHWEADQQAAAARATGAREELEGLEARLTQLEAQLAQQEAALSGLDDGWKEDAARLETLRASLAEGTRRQEELSLLLEHERANSEQLAGRLANHESNLANLSRRRAELQARCDRHAEEREKLQAELQKLEDARQEVADRVDAGRQASLEMEARRREEEEALDRTRQAFAENEIHVISLREELADRRSRLQSLEELQRHYEGFDRGVRAVMLRAGEQPREQGVFGLVADVLTVNPRFERAIEAALGERLQHVLVESRRVGLELLEFLRNSGEGRSTMLPVDLAPTEAPSLPGMDAPGVLAHALAEVTVEPVLQPVLERLLGDVVVVTDAAAAESLARSGGRGCTLVTLEGEVFRTDGSLTGGALEGPAVGALHKKRELAELAEEVASLEGRYNETLTRHYALQKQMGQVEGVLKGLSKNQHAEELRLATEEKDLHRAGEELSRVRERLGSIDREVADLTAQLSGLATEEVERRGEVAQSQAERAQREEKRAALAEEQAAIAGELEARRAEVVELQIKVASASERGASARKELEGLRSQRDELVMRQTRLLAAVEEAEGHAAQLLSRIEETRAGLGARAEALKEKTSSLGQRREAHTADAATIRELDVAWRTRREEVEGLVQELSQASMRGRELALELNHLQDGIRQRHQVELADELHRYHLMAPLDAQSEAQLAELRAALEKLGEVNFSAIDEAAELSGRHEHLTRQKLDLEESLAQLEEAITRIDATSRERFKQTFDIVNEKFQAVFPRLFGGGRASLVLTNDGPGQEPGVEIVAQPPGKKLQSVGLLSGGEKALTAVALIFGIFLIKPTPFCLLDEVDAPLDEGNVGRYNDMVREMSQTSQFILITHNKRTMEIGDTLYGVTMEEPGVSKQVSVRLREVAAANDDVSAAG
ncbi:MAG TPA: chromosome segregation protein SMC [Myxococcaceae bacterium]|nr:chromosome segregation protein SMC [Myxococcaceae bacterium]